MIEKAKNARYHSKENGWPEHERHRIAFPFATGAVPLATPWEELSVEQQAGKRLFMTTCVSCHDQQARDNAGTAWELHPLSYPRNGYALASARDLDAVTSASPYLLHDRLPLADNLSAEEKRGESIYHANCAFCHAADGTGRNWIGSFLEPHPRDFTDPGLMQNKSAAGLAQTIAGGLPGTSMPAWEDVLTPSEIRAVVAYILRAFQTAEPDAAKTRETVPVDQRPHKRPVKLS
jgi:cytochrome c oxidase cbb3-type subunit III